MSGKLAAEDYVDLQRLIPSQFAGKPVDVDGTVI